MRRRHFWTLAMKSAGLSPLRAGPGSRASRRRAGLSAAAAAGTGRDEPNRPSRPSPAYRAALGDAVATLDGLQERLRAAQAAVGAGPETAFSSRLEEALILPEQVEQDCDEAGERWAAFRALFERVDEQEDFLGLLETQLQRAVETEDYTAAASLAAAAARVRAADALGLATAAQSAAVAAEDFPAAAAARDQAGLALAGWWVGQGQGPESDPCGHILRLSPAHGRLVGQAFSPKDLADMRPGRHPTPVAALMPASAASVGGFHGGRPLLELFVGRTPGGGFRTQAVALHPVMPPQSVTESLTESGTEAVTEAATELTEAAAEQKDRGAASQLPKITVTVTGGGAAGREMEARLRRIFDLGPSGETGGTGETTEADTEAGAKPEAMPEAGAEAMTELTTEAVMEAVAESEAAAAATDGTGLLDLAAAFPPAGDAPSPRVDSSSRDGSTSPGARGLESLSSLDALSASLGDGLESLKSGLESLNSGLESLGSGLESGGPGGRGGRDMRVNIEMRGLDGSSPAPGSAPGAAPGAAPGQEPSTDSVTDSSPWQLARAPAALEPWSRDVFLFAHGPPPTPAPRAPEPTAASAAAASAGRASAAAVARAPTMASPPHVGRALEREEALWAQVSAQVSRLGALAGPERARLLAAVRSAAAAIRAARSAAGAADRPRRLAPRTRYRRLVVEPRGADPLSGLFVAAYGPHGQEMVTLRRGLWGDGDGSAPLPAGATDVVTAVKVTGDVNVPLGAATFRARVGRADRLPTAGHYPPELGVLARYPGEGCVAKEGFTQRRWVPGEMLVLDGRGGAMTGDAEVAFVWAVPGERRFLILFNRLSSDVFALPPAAAAPVA